MRPSEKFEAKAAGQKCSPEVVFSTLRTFLADNAGIGLPLGIERVIWIGLSALNPQIVGLEQLMLCGKM